MSKYSSHHDHHGQYGYDDDDDKKELPLRAQAEFDRDLFDRNLFDRDLFDRDKFLDQYGDDYNYETDDDDDYDDDTDDEPLPYQIEIEKRKPPKRNDTNGAIIEEDTAKLPPADQKVIDELNAHIEDGSFDPSFYGGYLDLVERLGHTPKSTNPYVKDHELNVWVYNNPFATGPDDTDERLNKKIQAHKSRVRYLRYQEYIDRLESKGLSTEGYFRSDDEIVEYIGPLDIIGEEDLNKFEDEDDLTNEQVIGFAKSFSASFATYINIERINLGMAHGMQKVDGKMVPPQIRQGMDFFNIEVSSSDIKKQIQEIINLYDTHQCPLGSALLVTDDDSSPKKKGKNKKKKGKQRKSVPQKNPIVTHTERIQSFLVALISNLEKNVSPSMFYAELLSEMSRMIDKGAKYDPAFSRCILFHENGKVLQAVMKLRRIAAQNAKDADRDPKRYSMAGFHWWLAYYKLTMLLVTSVCSLYSEKNGISKEDEDNAIRVFQECILPELLNTIQLNKGGSVWYCEERAVWSALVQCLCRLPKSVAMRFVKNHWDLMEASCLRDVSAELQDRAFDCDRVKQREEYMAPRAVAECVALVSSLCGYGMELKHGFMTRALPGPLAVKVLRRGVVPLLIKSAQSKNIYAANKATFGLGQISRIKDCREIIYQLPNNEGIKFVQELMASKHANCVSSALLLVLHLAWDKEWCKPLSEMEPPVEDVCLKMAAFGMKSILETVSEMREEAKRENHLHNNRVSKHILAKEDDQFLLLNKESERKLKNQLSWTSYEVEKNSGEITFLTISRCLLLFSSGCLLRYDEEIGGRARKIEGLHLANACIDIPIKESFNSVIALISNYMMFPSVPNPNDFSDPEHLIFSMFQKMEDDAREFDGEKQFEETDACLMRSVAKFYGNKEWKPIFSTLMKKVPYIAWYVEHAISRISWRENKLTEKDKNVIQSGTFREAEKRNGIHDRCSNLSGKLARCDNCGKIEGKRGEWKTCSRCNVAKYCGRDCQKADWKNHKKSCNA